MNKHNSKMTIKPGEDFDLNTISDFCRAHPNERVLIEISNTSGITPEMIRSVGNNADIRVVGPFTEEWQETYPSNVNFSNAVIYSKNELGNIIQEMREIERGIHPSWSDIQKATYIYEKMRTQIMMAPEYGVRTDKEACSLSGFLSRETRGAGYAVMYKEMLDRQGIESHYVQGLNQHAWNILKIDGKNYGVDLSFDNAEYRKGNIDGLPFFAGNTYQFNRFHRPSPKEPQKEAQKNLSEIDPKIIKAIVTPMRRLRDFNVSTFRVTRKDGTVFSVAQVGSSVVNDKRIFKYVYRELTGNSELSLPTILYGESNIADMVNSRKNKKDIDRGFESSTINILLSKENIRDSLNNGTFYLGSVKDANDNYVTDPRQIKKPLDMSDQFRIAPRVFRRSDGSVFVVQRTSPKPENVKGVDLFTFDIFETVVRGGIETTIKNTVFSERDFLYDSRIEVADRFLNRNRLDRKFNESSGYIGYLDHNGIKRINNNLLSEFDPNKAVDTAAKEPVPLPTFEEIKELVGKYEHFNEKDGDFDNSVSIRDIETKEKVSDKELASKALLANMWLLAAGSKHTGYDNRPGDMYALNDSSEFIYNKMVEQMRADIAQEGVIKPTDVRRHAADGNVYKYADDIVLNMFSTPYQTNFINDLVAASVADHPFTDEQPKPLHAVDSTYFINFGEVGKTK